MFVGRPHKRLFNSHENFDKEYDMVVADLRSGGEWLLEAQGKSSNRTELELNSGPEEVAMAFVIRVFCPDYTIENRPKTPNLYAHTG